MSSRAPVSSLLLQVLGSSERERAFARAWALKCHPREAASFVSELPGEGVSAAAMASEIADALERRGLDADSLVRELLRYTVGEARARIFRQLADSGSPVPTDHELGTDPPLELLPPPPWLTRWARVALGVVAVVVTLALASFVPLWQLRAIAEAARALGEESRDAATRGRVDRILNAESACGQLLDSLRRPEGISAEERASALYLYVDVWWDARGAVAASSGPVATGDSVVDERLRALGARWDHPDLRKVRLVGGTKERLPLPGINLGSADISEARFERVELSPASLYGTPIPARLDDAYAENTVLSDARLDGAVLRGARFLGARSVIRNVRFYAADLRGASFEDVTFDHVDFRCADLTDVEFGENVRFNEVYYSSKTIWPGAPAAALRVSDACRIDLENGGCEDTPDPEGLCTR
jgi:hypothetical protein